MPDENAYFLKALGDFEKKYSFARRILNVILRRKVEPRLAWANLLFFRLCTVGQSLLALCVPELRNQMRDRDDICVLDHSSIAALARNLLEAWVMFLYVSESAISDDEWLLRRQVLDLHDCTTRYRISKGIGDEKEKEEFRAKSTELKKAISANETFKNLDSKRQEKILGGQELYTDGRRSVVRQAGWDIDHFEAVYAALSSHAHSSPVSFYRTGLHPVDVDLVIPADFQFITAGHALEYLTEPLGFACERMFHLYPELFLTGETKH